MTQRLHWYFETLILTLSLLFAMADVSMADDAKPTGLAAAMVLDPDGPFVISPTDAVQPMFFGAEDAGRVAESLQDARSEQPDAVLLVEVSGTITVDDVPLRVPSRTCLIFLPGGGVTAADDASAECLVEIVQGEFVSLSTRIGTVAFDGRGKVATGIRVWKSGKVHLDRIAVTGCTKVGLDYTGRGGDRFADSGSITRSRFRDCGSGGIVVREAAQFLCIENRVAQCGEVGVGIESRQGLVAGNTVSGGDEGMRAGGAGLVVTRNSVGGRRVGLVATDSASGCLFSENSFSGGERVIELGGSGCALFGNVFSTSFEADDVSLRAESEVSRLQLQITGEGHTLVANRNVPLRDDSAAEALMFDPPAPERNRKEDVIVAGMGRFDVAVSGEGLDPTPLSRVQKTLDEARKMHPNDVIVATLTGLFIAESGPTGLRLPPNTCIVLDGTITVGDQPSDDESERHRLAQLVLMPSTGVASIADGILDGRGRTQHVVNAPGAAVVVLEGVTVRRSGYNGITTKERHHPNRPMFVRGCRVTENFNRGIWIHVCRSVHAIANVCNANGADGIDFDAYGRNSTALFNRCAGNRRHGVFVEEPGTADNTIFGNRLHANRIHEICLYNSSRTKPLFRNLLACNQCSGRGGISARALMHDNVLFNNVCYSGELIGGAWSGKNTYVAQNVTSAAAKTVTGNGPFFCTPGPAMLSSPQSGWARELGFARQVAGLPQPGDKAASREVLVRDGQRVGPSDAWLSASQPATDPHLWSDYEVGGEFKGRSLWARSQRGVCSSASAAVLYKVPADGWYSFHIAASLTKRTSQTAGYVRVKLYQLDAGLKNSHHVESFPLNTPDGFNGKKLSDRFTWRGRLPFREGGHMVLSLQIVAPGPAPAGDGTLEITEFAVERLAEAAPSGNP